MQLVLAFLFDDVVKGKIATPTFLVYRFREFICTLIGIIMVAATRRNKRAIAEAEKHDHELQEAYELEHAQDAQNEEKNSIEPVEETIENVQSTSSDNDKIEEKDIENNQ